MKWTENYKYDLYDYNLEENDIGYKEVGLNTLGWVYKRPNKDNEFSVAIVNVGGGLIFYDLAIAKKCVETLVKLIKGRRCVLC